MEYFSRGFFTKMGHLDIRITRYLEWNIKGFVV
jgi:hypothetical protein